MIEARTVINNCYILQEPVVKDGVSEYWRASAMFSATQFLVRFFDADIPEETIGRFRELVIRTYGVANDAVLDIVEADRYEGRFFVSSEFGGARRLRELFGTGFTASLDHVCRYAIELAKGLDEFHKHGIPYGTLTADCIWITREDGAITGLRFMKPGDLLFASLQPRDDPVFALEHQGYFAPEVKGEAAFGIDGRSDIYSLGIHLFRFLTGLMPFRGQSVARALDKAVSVLHVSNALMRRGIPEELVRIVVRCVRHNPKLRYQSVLDLVAELSAYADQRRKTLLKSGRADPYAELASLNKSKERQGVTQLVRAIDTVEYFHAASALAKGDPSFADAAPALKFPIHWKPETAEEGSLLELEELECVATGDEDALTTDDYLEMSRKAVGSSSKDIGLVEDQAPATPPASSVEPASPKASSTVPASPAMATGATTASPRPFAPAPAPQEPAPQEPARPSIPAAPLVRDGFADRRETEKRELNLPKSLSVIWKKESIRMEDVAGNLLAAFRDSFSGKGCFRFVEETDDPGLRLSFARAFAIMAEKAIMVEIAAKEDGTFGSRLEKALLASVESRPSRERRRVALRVKRSGESGLFGIGGDERTERSLLERAAEGLVHIPTGKHPFVLVIRDSETCDLATHELLMRVAGKVKHEPVCVFAFHRGKASASWHVLASWGL